MRNNLEHANIWQSRNRAPRFDSLVRALTGEHTMGDNDPLMHFLDGNGATRDVRLPEISPIGGQLFIITNTGDEALSLIDVDGVAQTTIEENEAVIVGSSPEGWTVLRTTSVAQSSTALVQVTASPTTLTGGTRFAGVVRAAPAATTINLPTVAAQGTTPLTIFDWSSGILGGSDHTITITPNGSEKIMLQSSWPIVSNSVQLASVTLYPQTDLLGWNI